VAPADRFQEELMTRPSVKTRAALWTAAGVLGAGLAAGGIAEAVSTATPSPDAGQAAGHGDKAAAGKHHGQRLKLDRIASRVVHGDVVVRTKDGYRTVVLQRGSVVSVSASSLQLRSADGFTATYVLTGETRIHKGHKNAKTSELAAGDAAIVVADRSGSGLTATRVLAHPARAGKPASQNTGQ